VLDIEYSAVRFPFRDLPSPSARGVPTLAIAPTSAQPFDTPARAEYNQRGLSSRTGPPTVSMRSAEQAAVS
jgi:hypothetical protein